MPSLGQRMSDGMVAGGWCLGVRGVRRRIAAASSGISSKPIAHARSRDNKPQAHREAKMSIGTRLALAAVIILSGAATASAAAKKQKVPRSGPQAQAIAPGSAQPFNQYSPSLTGAGSPGYNQSLMTWR